MKWNKQFDYPTSTRALIDGKRHYDVGHSRKVTKCYNYYYKLHNLTKKKKGNIGQMEAECWRK